VSLVVRFDDEVRVVVLNRELDDAKRIADRRRPIRRVNRCAQLLEDAGMPQRGQPAAHPKRHMNWYADCAARTSVRGPTVERDANRWTKTHQAGRRACRIGSGRGTITRIQFM